MRARRRNPCEDAARKRWLEEAAKWDGRAVVFNPNAQRYELADWYKGQLAEPMMYWFDRLLACERRRIANSVDGE